MTSIFISHSSKDNSYTDKLYKRLRTSFRDNVFYDRDSLRGGDDWWPKITQHIAGCTDFLFVLSSNSQESQYCQKELKEAKDHNKKIIVLVLKESNVILDGLNDLHHIKATKNLTGKTLNEIYAAIIRNENPSEASDTVIRRQDDLALAQKLWQYIYSNRISNIFYFAQEYPIRDSDLNELREYLIELRSMPESYFHNDKLEQSFRIFDDSLIEFFNVIENKVNVHMIPEGKEFSFIRLRPDDHMDDEKIFGTVTRLVDKHHNLAKLIKTLYPGFNFSPEATK